jgi:hypothetical protein
LTSDLDALARELHLDVTLLRRDLQRRGPVRRAVLDVDVLAREQVFDRTNSKDSS